MSVAFESNSCSDSNRIQSPGFSHGMWIYNISDATRFAGANPWTTNLPAVKEEEDSTSSSSIGNNSDAGRGDSDEDDGEVQSKDSSPLNELNSLEQVLPIKRGLSSFYAGKSKSYGSLADATSVQSIQDIVKPEDAYSRKRKNNIATTIIFEKLRKSTTDNGVSKRVANSTTTESHSHGRSLPPLPKNSRSIVTTNGSSDSSSSSSSSSPGVYLTPWRSLSLSDLELASGITNSVINETDEGGENSV